MRPDQMFNQFFQQFSSVIGPGAETLNAEVQQKMRAAAQAAFDKLDLVSRDEFNAQRAVLARTREKLEQLEAQIAELEQRLDAQNKG